MKNRTPLIVWLLVAALALVGAAVWEMGTELESRPVTSNTGPSGTAALAELLRSQGFPVRTDRSARFKARPGEVVVAVGIARFDPMAEFWRGFNESQGFDEPGKEPTRLFKALAKAARGGATVVYCEVPQSLDEAYEGIRTTTATAYAPKPLSYKVSYDENLGEPDVTWLSDSHPYDWFTTTEFGWWVRVQNMGEGRAVVLTDGLSATNRYLDAEQNADYWTALLTVLGGKVNGVVFADAMGGDEATPGLLGSLGPWAVAAQWQMLFVFGMAAWWLGQRFGPALPSIVRDVSSRGTTMALAAVLHAGRHYGTAARILAQNRLVAIRRAQGMPPSTTPAQVLASVPKPVAEALTHALSMPDKGSGKAALAAIRAVDEAVEASNLLRYRQ